MASSQPSELPSPPAPWGAVLDASNELIALVDDEARMHWANARFVARCGAARPGMRLDTAMRAADPHGDGWSSLFEGLAQGSPFEHPRLPWHDAQGQARWGHLRAQPLPGTAPPLWACAIEDTAAAEQQRDRLTTAQDTEAYRRAESSTDTRHPLEIATELSDIGVWRQHLPATGTPGIDAELIAAGLPLHEESGGESAVAEALATRVHPDDLPGLAQAAERVLHGDGPVDATARVRNGAGGWRYLHTRRVARRGMHGELIEVIGVTVDITDQTLRLRRNDELAARLQITASTAGLGLWTRSTLTGHIEWNAQMFELVGRAPSLGVPSRSEWLEQIVHAEDRARMRQFITQTEHAVGGSADLEHRIVRGDGKTRWLVHRTRPEVIDGELMLFGITIDVTERVEAEIALRQANERVALAVHGAGIGTWERDVRNDVVQWDAQMYRLRGLDPAAAGPSDLLRYQLSHPDDIDRILRLNEESVRDHTTCTYEFRARMPDGSFRWMASRSVPVVDESGEVVRQIGVNWDVHERVVAEAERQDKLVAQRESQAKSEFLARMSHELRTPLNAVLGFTQLLQLERASPLSEGQRTKLGHIRSAGEHLLSLINDVLDLSSLESGQLRLDLQPVPLAEVLGEAMDLLEPTARSAGVLLQALPMDAVLRVDRIRTRQVLINLLSNAIKYNRAAGRVTLSADTEGEQVVLRVQDTGRGMNAEQLVHLFEPFNRLGMEREGIEGSGMGLAVVKALVERMDGSVAVLSEAGVGSCFEVRLPRDVAAESVPDPSPAEPDASSAPHPPTSARRGQVLYIEDNPVNVLLVEELVRTHAGLAIESAVNGVEGVERARALRPDLILVDMQLPDIHGAEVLRRLRGDARTAHIPCIALSANALPDDVRRATAAGFSDYWTKPIHAPTFLKALARLFPAEGR